MPIPDESQVERFQAEHLTPIRVRYCEIDGQGRVHNSQYLNYFERGRVEMLRSFGISYKELEKTGLMLVVKTMHVEFHSPAEFDEELELITRIRHCFGARIDHDYHLRRAKTDDRSNLQSQSGHPSHSGLVVSGHSSIACVDRTGRVRRLPQALQILRSEKES